MIILDEDGKALDAYDEEKGCVTPESVGITGSYVVDSEEEGHYEVVAEYPETGGKDVEWVVDSPEEGHWEVKRNDTGAVVDWWDGVPADWPHEQEYANTVSTYLYRAYTEEELAERAEARADAELQAQIDDLRAKLTGTDYVVVKMTEYSLTGTELPDEDAERYASIIEQREAWRSEAHDLLATQAERLAARAGA